jgi:hypothetical protein
LETDVILLRPKNVNIQNKVERAPRWLKLNHLDNRNIIISPVDLTALPLDDDVSSSLVNIGEGDVDESEEALLRGGDSRATDRMLRGE